MANLQRSKYLLQNLVIKQKKSKKIAQISTNYTFLKRPWPSKFELAITFWKF